MIALVHPILGKVRVEKLAQFKPFTFQFRGVAGVPPPGGPIGWHTAYRNCFLYRRITLTIPFWSRKARADH